MSPKNVRCLAQFRTQPSVLKGRKGKTKQGSKPFQKIAGKYREKNQVKDTMELTQMRQPVKKSPPERGKTIGRYSVLFRIIFL